MEIKIPLLRRVLCFIILFFIPSILLPQHDSSSIRQKILESEESDPMLIQRTRNFILNKLEAGNIHEAFAAYEYANEKLQSEAMRPFWISEELLLGYWFGTYELVYSADSLENSTDPDWRDVHPFGNYLYPQRDRLATELSALSTTHRSELLHRVDSLVIDKEKHDFLVLHFDWLTFDATASEMTGQKAQDYLELDLTPRAEEFLVTHRDSRFRPYVQRHFRYVYVLNDWGFGYSLGLGSFAPQNAAERYLKPDVSLGFGADLSWKNMLMSAGFDIGIPVSIRQPFVYKGKTWNTEVRHNYYAFYASFGWVVEESQMFKLAPHVGIGAFEVSVCEADKNKPGGDVSMTQGTMQYGLTCDMKFETSDAYYRENSYSYTGVRVSLEYFQFLGNNPILSGGMLRFNLAWIGFGRSILRDL